MAENVQDQSAVQDGMTVEEAQENAPTVDMEQLLGNVTSEEDPEPEQEQQQEEPQEPEQTPEEARAQAIKGGFQALYEDGWTQEELLRLSRDKTVREDIAAGKDFYRAVSAYERRQRAQSAPAKRGVPTLKTPSAVETRKTSAIEEMRDAEFAKFSDEAIRLARQGKRVTIR